MAEQNGRPSAGAGFALGVDLGTSNTVAVLRWPDGRTRPLLFDGLPIMPSGVFLDAYGQLHVGRDAQRLAQGDPARYEPNPKRRVDEAAVLLGDREVPVADLFGAVLNTVARVAVEAVGFLPPAVVTHPAPWGARRRQVLAAAVARAGWPPVSGAARNGSAAPAAPAAHAGPEGGAGGWVGNGGPAAAGPGSGRSAHAEGGVGIVGIGSGQPGYAGSGPVTGTLLLPEPVAAARYFTDVLRRPVPAGGSVMVFDFGGGTLDVAVVRNEGPDASGRARFVVLGSGGVAELGGLDLDAALVEHLGRLLSGSAPGVWAQLADPRTPSQWRARRQFWDDVRGAKEMLSRSASAPVPVPGMDQAVHLTREELERVAVPLLRGGVFEAARVATDSAVRPDQLAGLFLVGGSSRVPLVARMLHAQLGVAPTVLEQPELPVAEGALTELVELIASATGAPRSGPAAAGLPVSPGGPLPGAYVAPGSGPVPGPLPGGSGAARRRRALWIALATAVALLAGAGGLVLYLNRGPQELAFTDVHEIARIGVGNESPYRSYTQTVGERAYLAWQVADRLEVIGVEAGSGKQRWRHSVSGRSEQWDGIRAYPNLLLAFADAIGTAVARPVYALDPSNGRELWRHDIHGDDLVLVYDQVVVLVDNEGDRLVGLDPRTGAQRWATGNPKNQYGSTDATVYPVLTVDDAKGPADATGRAFAPVIDDDYRLVQIGSDRRARVLDARSGKVLAQRGNVGEPGATFLAYAGRLFAAASGGGYEIFAYDLDGMGEPRSVYRAPDGDRSLQEIEPCGPDRVCVRDYRSAAESVEVAAIDAADGGQLWRRPAPQAEGMVPVGDRVLVEFSGADERWTLRDGKGAELLSRQGQAVRVDDGNLLTFTGSFSSVSADLSVAGVGAVSGSAKELGPLRDARGETCSWNTSVITCMTATDFVLWRFAKD